MPRFRKGTVFLVGAGPGDPGLLTLRGLEVLRRAEVVIYDNLCNLSLLAEVPRGAEVMDAGKHSGTATPRQKIVGRLMIRRARAGRMVVRLKGGDPFVFGRGGEEAVALARAGIPFEVVPGVTSAIAVPAYAGIPVTHRDHASGFAVVTGHEELSKREPAIDYDALARFPGTVVFLMGVRRLGKMVERLRAAGKSASTPAALIRWGTRAAQRTLTGRLGNIAARAEKAAFRAPAVLVVGEVVRCRQRTAWVEKKALFGARVVVTRSRKRAGGLSARLRELGAEVIEVPLIEIVALRGREVKAVVRRADRWDWIVFASAEGAEHFLDAVLAEHGDLRALGGAKLAVVGEATAAHLAERGLRAELISPEGTAASLAGVLRRKESWRGKRVLLPGSFIGGREVEKALRAQGAETRFLPIYTNRRPRLTWEISALERAGAEVVAFTSASTARNFALLLKDRRLSRPLARRLRGCYHISIGPSTSAALRGEGLRVAAQARRPSLDDLVAAVVKAWQGARRPRH